MLCNWVLNEGVLPPPPPPPQELVNIDVHEVFTPDELSTLTNVWQAQPAGKFLKGRHGITHYKVNHRKESYEKGMVILCHGLGQSMKMYQELTDILINEGFSVLRYDYFGHGYSKYQGDKNDKWIKYTTEIFVDQLEDLMDHVIKESQQEIVAFVGHSNGGVVGIAANYRWSRGTGSPRKILPKLILCNPAVYARKPFVAQIADRIPTVMTTLMKVIPPALSLVGENYIQSIENESQILSVIFLNATSNVDLIHML